MAHQWHEQAVRMAALHIALYAFGTKHAVVERKIFPGLKPNDLVLSNLQLDTALLSTKTAMSLNQLLRRVGRFILPSAGRNIVEMRPELFTKCFFGDRSLSHAPPL